MNSRLASRAERRRKPPAAEAAPNLLVHELKHLASRLHLLTENLGTRFDDAIFRDTARELLSDTVRQIQRLAGELHEREGRLLVKLRVDLNEILDEALCSCQPELAGKVELEEHCGELPQIWGDRFLLRRAFCCAIENALEAMEGCGTLLVASGVVARRGAPRIVVEIMDDGPGMSPEFQRRLLARQFSSTKSDGLGLGVYTVRQVAALHGGSVRIASEPGAGTRVRFFFPIDEA